MLAALDRRVEVLLRVSDEVAHRELDDLFDAAMAPGIRCWELDGDGGWHRVPTTNGIDAHRELMERAVARSHELRSDGWA